MKVLAICIKYYFEPYDGQEYFVGEKYMVIEEYYDKKYFKLVNK